MSTYFNFEWLPRGPNFTTLRRTFDAANENCLVEMKIPFPQWPNEPTYDINSNWEVIHDKAVKAMHKWEQKLSVKAEGEQDPELSKQTCRLQMIQQLKMLVGGVDRKERYLRLFYGFIADEIASRPEFENMELGEQVIQIVDHATGTTAIVNKKYNAVRQ